VVSTEEVAAGRKGRGGAWGSTSRNTHRAGLYFKDFLQRASPAKWSNTSEHRGEKSSEPFDRRAVGCNVVVLKMTCSQSGGKVQWHFLAPPVRATQGA
jgi:hypothetical protein